MGGGGGGGEAGRGLKKGPWTAAEDAMLREYVKKHGEGNWNAVRKKSGLLRCGKSCRLRWANHLRPNLKKGSFTPQEEHLILHLHSSFGNKWARMASQLPGRTDNEIKNYWNTRMKRHQRAGLPLYPQEMETRPLMPLIHPSSNSPSSSSSFSDPITSQIFNLYTNHHHNDHDNITAFGFSFPFSSSSSSNDLSNPNPLLDFVSGTNNNNNNNNNNSSVDVKSYMGEELGVSSSPLELDILDLPSNQTPTTSFTSNYTLDDDINDESCPMPRGNSGLLDALLEESQALSRGGLLSKEITPSSALYEKEKRVDQEPDTKNLSSHLTSSYPSSSTGRNPNEKKNKEATWEQSMMMGYDDDDDEMLITLLSNFPSSTPLPDWYPSATANPSDGSDFISPIENTGLDPSPASSSGVDPMLSCCYWSNMPGIC